MSTSDYNGTWAFIAQMGILFGAVIIANILRRKIPFIRKSLLPSAVIGGLLILLLKLIPPVKAFINEGFMEIVAYHCLGLGFISMTLKDSGKKQPGQGMTIFKTGATVVNTYLIQVIVGMLITIPLSLLAVYKEKLFPGAGVLLAFGFGQGPGQALNNGVILQTEHPYFEGANFGLAIATCGFFVACLVGVVYLNIAKKKGKIKNSGGDFIDETDENAKDIIPVSQSIDRLTMQIALVFAIYAISYLFLFGLEKLCAAATFLGNFGKTISDLFYGFNFLIGVLAATLVKLVLKLLRKTKLMGREYTNDFLLTRISNFFFDVMIVAGVAAIRLDALENYWWILILLGVVGVIVTYAYNRFVAKRLFGEYAQEQFLMMYGMLTGTASTGTILLREIDPEFETPAADNMVYQNFPAIVFGLPMMFLATLAPKKPLLTLIIFIAFFALLNIILFRASIFKKRTKKDKK